MTCRPAPVETKKNAPDKVGDRCPATIPAWAIAVPAHAAELVALATPIGDAQVITIKEAAAIFRVCTRTVRRMIDRGELNAIRVGRSVRLRAGDMENIVNSAHFPFSERFYRLRE